jgi:hypothetical protein
MIVFSSSSCESPGEGSDVATKRPGNGWRSRPPPYLVIVALGAQGDRGGGDREFIVRALEAQSPVVVLGDSIVEMARFPEAIYAEASCRRPNVTGLLK